MHDELLAALARDYGVHPYGKWRGAFWRLASLVDLGVERGHALAAARQTLDWVASPSRLGRIHKRVIDGRVRRCASQEGLALYTCLRVGLRDERLDTLAESLVETQWPDGGWNCDVRPEASHSSFNETWGPLLGLAEYGAKDAAERAAEFLLLHRVYRLPDGTWRTDGKWWNRPGSKGSNVEAVNWGEAANEFLTERALSVLGSAGR